jgi:hypothetical protein
MELTKDNMNTLEMAAQNWDDMRLELDDTGLLEIVAGNYCFADREDVFRFIAAADRDLALELLLDVEEQNGYGGWTAWRWFDVKVVETA